MDRFRGLRTDVEGRLDRMGAGPIQNFFSAWADTTQFIVLSDAHFREAERCNVFGVRAAKAEDAVAVGKRYNELARDLIAGDLQASIRGLRDYFTEAGPVDASASLEAGERIIREGLVDLPLNVHEAREGEVLLRNCFEIASAGGEALCDYMIERSEQLGLLRAERENRNDPVAQIVVGALLLAAALALMIWCARPGPPSCGDPAIVGAVVALILIGGWVLSAGIVMALAPAVA